MTRDELREKALALPLQPGVYIMMDRLGEVAEAAGAFDSDRENRKYF